jgi:hypothetical protein
VSEKKNENKKVRYVRWVLLRQTLRSTLRRKWWEKTIEQKHNN